MKKILFLLIICIIKLNAYEYEIYHSPTTKQATFFVDPNGVLKVKVIHIDGRIIYEDLSLRDTYSYLSNIKFGNISTSNIFTEKNVLDNWLKSDLNFLNDFYTQKTNYILNYFYNQNRFSNNNYILYQDYELLYNSDGLAVESIVDGEWAGLYSDSEKGASGRLYSSSGVLLYVNGDPVNTFEQLFEPVVRLVIGCLKTAVDLIASPVGVVVSVVFVMVILYFVVWLGHRSLRAKDGF